MSKTVIVVILVMLFGISAYWMASQQPPEPVQTGKVDVVGSSALVGSSNFTIPGLTEVLTMTATMSPGVSFIPPLSKSSGFVIVGISTATRTNFGFMLNRF